MRAWVYLALGMALALRAAAADEELLRKAWTFQPGPRAELLGQARGHFRSFAARLQVEPAVRDRADREPTVQWLAAHADATYLVLDEELAKQPRGAVRSACLLLAGRIHNPGLGQYVHKLLPSCSTNADRLEVLQCMSALQDPQSVKALAAFLAKPTSGASDEMLAEAARGLGMTRRPEYLSAISRVRGQVVSLAARFELAKAACRCGDADAVRDVAAVLKTTGPALKLHADAIAFLCENFSDAALNGLSEFVETTGDDELAVAATWAIINGTRYGRDPAAMAARPASEYETAAPAAGDDSGAQAAGGVLPGLPKDVSKLSREERRELIGKVSRWWREEGKALRERGVRSSDVS